MKKLLLTLSSVLVVGGTASSVVSCGVKPEKEVIFMLFGTTSSSGDQEKRQNFQDLADGYNEIHKNDEGFVRVKAVMKDSSYLNLAVQSGDNLPDLYVSYVDAASTYTDSIVGDDVRDMESSMGEEGFNKFKNDLITPAFMEEGQYKDHQIVLPFGKSFDISVINVNLFLQFMELMPEVKSEEVRTGYTNYNKERQNLLENKTDLSGTKVFKDNLKFSSSAVEKNDNTITLSGDIYNNLKTLLQGVKTVDDIKKVFGSTTSVLLLANAMHEIVKQDGLNVRIPIAFDNEGKVTKYAVPNKAYNFGFGIDSLDNKYYMDYAATNNAQEGVIDVQQEINKEAPEKSFWYSTSYNDKVASIELNANSQGFINTTKYLQGMKDIAQNGNDTASTDWKDHWNGVFSTAWKVGTQQNWITEDFVKATMFMGSASSANDYYFTDSFKNKEVGTIDANGSSTGTETLTYAPVSKADVITTATTNGENTDKDVFLSQGRGIAGFKSKGSNAVQKEETVKGFLNYIMQPQQTAYYGLKTSYMPATKTGMEIYKNYLNENYNNSLNIDGKNPIVNETELAKAVQNIYKIETGNDLNDDDAKAKISEYFKPILNSSKTPEVKAGVSVINSSFIKEYLEKIISGDSSIALVSSKAIPTTDIIRAGLKPALTGTNGLLDLKNTKNISMDQLLADDNSHVYNLKAQLESNKGDFYKDINITFTPKKS